MHKLLDCHIEAKFKVNITWTDWSNPEMSVPPIIMYL